MNNVTSTAGFNNYAILVLFKKSINFEDNQNHSHIINKPTL